MFKQVITLGAALLSISASFAQEQILNLYSARHYSTDEALYGNFTKATGIRINRIDADDAGILARLKAEGAASPADVILLVDAARLYKGEVDGLFQPVKSKVLEDTIPAQFRGKPGPEGTPWFGFSTRARVVVFDKLKVKRDDVDTSATEDADEDEHDAADDHRGDGLGREQGSVLHGAIVVPAVVASNRRTEAAAYAK